MDCNETLTHDQLKNTDAPNNIFSYNSVYCLQSYVPESCVIVLHGYLITFADSSSVYSVTEIEIWFCIFDQKRAILTGILLSMQWLSLWCIFQIVNMVLSAIKKLNPEVSSEMFTFYICTYFLYNGRQNGEHSKTVTSTSLIKVDTVMSNVHLWPLKGQWPAWGHGVCHQYTHLPTCTVLTLSAS